MLRRNLLAALALLAAAPAFAREGPPAAPQNTVRVRPVMVPVITNGQVERYVTYEVTLEIAEPGRMPEIQGKTPRLQDTVTAVVYEGVEKGWIVHGVVTNGNALRARLEEACNGLLGKGTVARALINPATRSAM
ncbi:hypothetical protein [Azospirillum sp. TSO22-1]|uniref:hypothetical protein n=1 Tax=Azospirillum sp. TSO22-1 TaxID=716789 RepID=UPI000D61C510|nr:hypothetical protein [Azospirillum sp. TSO22-1]PWC38356.1 hypothetical protein TSO221_26940 [Azospirillum sp. TSO22-1]